VSPYTDHLRTAGGALKRWFVATLKDAAAVGTLWLAGLLLLGVPLAPLWAVLGAIFQFVPNLGPVLSLVGPALALLASGADRMRFVYLLILFAGITLIDGLALQPLLMKQSNRVPIWVSILAPIALGLAIPFWGVLLAPPLLAVVYAFRSRTKRGAGPQGQRPGGPARTPNPKSPVL
jgi:predicted PurR-regulated permease PerM